MVIRRTEGQTDIKAFDPVLAQLPVFSGIPKPLKTGLGFNWGLAIQIAGWTINGIGLGLSTYEAVRGAKDKSGVEKLEPGEISAIASQIAQADPQHRSASQWESILGTQFGGAQVAQPQPIPEGYYLNPQTGQLVALPGLKKAGMFGDVPPWALVGGGLLIFLVLKGGGLKL